MTHRNRTGFTIVELLIVIVVIGILAAITVVAYNGVQAKAQTNKIKTDMAMLTKSIILARESQSKTLGEITGSTYSAGGCAAKTPGTNLADLPKTDSCWVSYLNALDAISTAGGLDIRRLVDPWGRPYFIDENEGERGGCLLDVIAGYAQPFNQTVRYPSTQINVPLSGFSGCS